MLVLRASYQGDPGIEAYISQMSKECELEVLDKVLEEESFLKKAASVFPKTKMGRSRIAVEQTIRCGLWMKRHGLSYRELAHDLEVNLEAQWFCKVRQKSRFPSFSSLQQNISQLDEKTWKKLNDWIVDKGRQKHKTKGLKCRKDSTVVEAKIKYPKDGEILIDGIRVVVREVKKALGGNLPKGFRTFKQKLKEVRNRLRHLTRRAGEKINEVLEDLCEMGRHVVNVTKEVNIEKVRQVRGLLEQVLRQTTQVIAGVKHIPHRIVSFHQNYARPIVKGKAGKSCEFGLGVQIQEDEMLITDWEVQEVLDDEGSLDRGLDQHEKLHRHPPKSFSGDTNYGNEKKKTWERLKERGVEEVSIPFRGKHKAKYGGPRFRKLQAWRSGSEGTISELKRFYGLAKVEEKGEQGFRRAVGWGIVTRNLWKLARKILAPGTNITISKSKKKLS
jgi:IS5 family transposase